MAQSIFDTAFAFVRRFLGKHTRGLPAGLRDPIQGALKNNLDGAGLHNARKRIESIHEHYYPRFKEGKDVKAWFARKDLEVGRYYLDPSKGYAALDEAATCGPAQRLKPEYKELEQLLAKGEKLVEEIERAKGVTFKGIKNRNSVLYEDKDGNVLSKSDSV